MITKKYIAGVLVTVGMIAGVCFGMSHVVSADDDRGQQFRDAHALGSSLEVHINDNGNVLVRGAKVTGVNGSTVSATTAWNSASLNWSVLTNGNTSFVARKGSGALSNIAVGDYVSFSGSLASGTSGSFTVNAKAVKDWSMTIPVNAKSTVEGNVKSVSGAGVPTSFVLTVEGKDYTVRVASDTSVLNALWLHTSFSNIRVGDSVRVYGMINSDMTIDATVVRDTSIRI